MPANPSRKAAIFLVRRCKWRREYVANEVIAVDLSAVEAFLGRIQDPPSAKTMPIHDSAFRAIMFTDMVGSTEMTAQLGDTCPWASAWTLSAVSPVRCINKTECCSTFSIVPIRQELHSVFALDFQVLDVQFGNFLRRNFHIVTVQEDSHLLPPH